MFVTRKYKAAAVQAEPGWFDLEKSVQKTIRLIQEAGEKGCKLIAFSELWIPGYPYFLWRVKYQDSLPLLKEYHQNSLRPDSNEMRRIRAAAKTAQIFVSLGYSEVEGHTLYMAQVIIDPTGTIINHRRKIKPTHVERLGFGEGTGDSLNTVVQTEIGRLGHLNCWESMNPFLKALNCAQHEEIHVTAWPASASASTLEYPAPYFNTSEALSELVTPAYAYETGTWTLAPTQVVTREGARLNLPKHLQDDEKAVDAELDIIGNGFTRIYRPDGSRAVEAPPKTFEGLVVADVDLDENLLTKHLADFGGHYMRPDLIRLLVDKSPKTLIVDAHSTEAKPHTIMRDVGDA
ncbi:Nitrilase/cyanide hydratase and apolipoprotein N-acyltransferase [Cordyceps fumosorosea ARSEF 2679]|uniref:Nitrilase/cyanide hydratase and apolipoprotein N-acyltransferase n=1 Tax=Cordyceps fumosorosea (strain ARSEF 2679) TaxID=1081104 RepID=A0A162JAX1_CORFA|nr:Nitrilase/cyanide hydratase and apolipoprotein N-acyltransferase [Cordyceps fumosorosea ARSEF 2679]OAA66282.1 Nitrilase/cyanide hydratase and apolipoprotein N-acyltransferase [Cordyceps fumosorosea ARSEF 2679]